MQYDKIFLEEQIDKGVNDEETTNKYIIIKSYYEKYLEIINDKMVDNIEQNLILNFNLKEINELNENNQQQLEKLFNRKEEFQSTNPVVNEEQVKEINGVEEEIANIKKIIAENEKVREGILKNLDVSSNFINLRKI